jgi:hypothetical protein
MRMMMRALTRALVIVCVWRAGKTMADVYKEVAASQDYENKWAYFGAADGSYSIYPGQ